MSEGLSVYIGKLMEDLQNIQRTRQELIAQEHQIMLAITSELANEAEDIVEDAKYDRQVVDIMQSHIEDLEKKVQLLMDEIQPEYDSYGRLIVDDPDDSMLFPEGE